MADEPQDVYTLTDLEQIKVLADPLRIKILEALCEERTTKQVADHIGEKPTKLYHHVEALERVGLIRPTRTKQNRGTLEKYYQAVAKQFRAGSGAFSGGEATDEKMKAMQDMLSTIFDGTAAELRDLVAAGIQLEELEEEGIVSYVELHATDEEIAELLDRFNAIIKRAADTSAEGTRRYRLTLAFFPLDRSAGSGPPDS